jgi:hypothetical protein
MDTFPVPMGQIWPAGHGSQEEKSGVPRHGAQVPAPQDSQEIDVCESPTFGWRYLPGGQISAMVVPKSGQENPGGHAKQSAVLAFGAK